MAKILANYGGLLAAAMGQTLLLALCGLFFACIIGLVVGLSGHPALAAWTTAPRRFAAVRPFSPKILVGRSERQLIENRYSPSRP